MSWTSTDPSIRTTKSTVQCAREQAMNERIRQQSICVCTHHKSQHQRWLAITFPGIREDRYTSCLEDGCDCEEYTR